MIKVLLVDDHELFRQGIRSLLSEIPDIEVIGDAEDGSIAVQRTGELSPDVVIMDLVMPIMDGIDAAQRISEQYPATKILILSMYEDGDHVRRILRAGASGYVLKRSASDELIRAIRVVHAGGSSLAPSVAAMVLKDFVRKPSEQGDPRSDSALTEREIQILKLIAEGNSNQRIADQLSLSKKTVDTHRNNIMRKLDMHEVTELVKYALRYGLIKLES